MIITHQKIDTINKKLEENNLRYTIHLSDTCGSQSMWIEADGLGESAKRRELMYTLISDYFKSIHAEIEFSWDHKSFHTKDRSVLI
ncbi:MAG: hypothetical protein RR564_00910 [Eubacterium sp.]